MDNLLFTALIIALLYYYGYYLPQQKHPKKQTISTQTEPFTNPEVAELKTKHQELATELQTKSKDYQQSLKDKDFQITNLQKEVRDLAKRPLKPTNSKGIQTDPETELTNTLDTLIKDIQTLNNSLN